MHHSVCPVAVAAVLSSIATIGISALCLDPVAEFPLGPLAGTEAMAAAPPIGSRVAACASRVAVVTTADVDRVRAPIPAGHARPGKVIEGADPVAATDWRARARRAERHVERLRALLADRRIDRAVLAVAALSDRPLDEVDYALDGLFEGRTRIPDAVELLSAERVHELMGMYLAIRDGAAELEAQAGLQPAQGPQYEAFAQHILRPYLGRARADFHARVECMGLPEPMHSYLANRWK